MTADIHSVVTWAVADFAHLSYIPRGYVEAGISYWSHKLAIVLSDDDRKVAIEEAHCRLQTLFDTMQPTWAHVVR